MKCDPLFQGTGHLNLIIVALRFCKTMDPVPSSPLLEVTEACILCSAQETHSAHVDTFFG